MPDRISEQLSDEAESAQIRSACRQIGLDRPMLWTQNPRAANLVDRLPVVGVLYDLTDDWAAFERDPSRRSLVQSQIEALGRRADLVLACSRLLEADARRWGAQPLYLPNAVDPPEPERPLQDEIARLPRPRLGYTGTLHSARLDVELLIRAATLRPEWSFIFIGPDVLKEPDRTRLFTMANVHHLGVRPHADVRSFLVGLDVGLVPNLVTDFTRSLDPLKTYEYLAAGLPVIATPAGVPAELAGYVDLARTSEELVAVTEAVLRDNGPALAQARRAVMAEQTWGARAARIEQALGVRSARGFTREVSVVVVSFNTRDLLERCLTGLSGAQAGIDLQTIIVDNASTDGSQELVRERFAEVELVELAENVGFGRANNLAFERCRGEYVLLLNSDACMDQGALSELLAAAKRHPGAAAIGPRLLNPDGSLQRSAWPFPDPVRLLLEAFGLHRILRRTRFYEDLGIWAHDEERTVDFLIGACLLLRAEALHEVGGFDERFWMYAEEADLQQRLRARGWKVIFTPAATVTHVGSGSSRTHRCA